MDVSRYSRQIALPHIGEKGQEKLARSTVAVIGCGALGTVAADLLARAGVGRIRIIDRDVVELSNLQRQTLFDEEDARQRQPKAQAAVLKLRRVNSCIELEALVEEFRWDNALALLSGVDLVLDATDNYLARLTVNDACLEKGIPWVYGGAVGYLGMTMNVVSGSPCFRCLMTELPPPGVGESCDVVGVLASVTVIIAANQVAEALKLLVTPDLARRELLEIDLLKGEYRPLPLTIDPNCPACQLGQRDFLLPDYHQESAVVCGRNSVMLHKQGSESTKLDLEAVANRLTAKGFEVRVNPFRLQMLTSEHEIILFADGRALVNGTSKALEAKKIYNNLFGL